MSNNSTRPTYLEAYRFIVELDNVNVGSFRTMSGLGTKQDVVEFKLGGDKSVRRKPGRTSFGNIVLERGFSTGRELWDWRKNVVDGKGDRRSGSIVFLNPDASEARRYNFFRAWPVSWDGPSLAASGTDMAIEKLELAVEWVEIADADNG